MYNENFVLDGRRLSANLVLAADQIGSRAALISIEEDGVEVARLKLVAPLPLLALKWINHNESQFLQACWSQAVQRRLVHQALSSSEIPLVVTLE
jgi:hypothetical protein